MTNWLKRYKDGQCAEVWAEMEALGAAIHKPAHREPAQAVVLETMRRARKNVDWLFEALPSLGYRFAGEPEPAEPDYPLELRIAGALEYARRQGAKDPWSHGALAWLEEEEIELPAHYRNGRPGRVNFQPPSPRNVAGVDPKLPLAVRGWFETVGQVDLAGTHPLLNPSGKIAALRVKPDTITADADAVAGAEFVASLRHAFEWAGFPGWSAEPDPPQRELDWLREKLVTL